MATCGLAQALAHDLGPSRSIHVFHVIIDGLVKLGDGTPTDKADNEFLYQADIAETYSAVSQLLDAGNAEALNWRKQHRRYE